MTVNAPTVARSHEDVRPLGQPGDLRPLAADDSPAVRLSGQSRPRASPPGLRPRVSPLAARRSGSELLPDTPPNPLLLQPGRLAREPSHPPPPRASGRRDGPSRASAASPIATPRPSSTSPPPRSNPSKPPSASPASSNRARPWPPGSNALPACRFSKPRSSALPVCWRSSSLASSSCRWVAASTRPRMISQPARASMRRRRSLRPPHVRSNRLVNGIPLRPMRRSR